MIVALELMYLITKQSQKVERACNRIHELERPASGSENALQNICWERGIRSRNHPSQANMHILADSHSSRKGGIYTCLESFEWMMTLRVFTLPDPILLLLES